MKSFHQYLKEDLRKWFGDGPDGDWQRINSKGEAVGACARAPGEPKPDMNYSIYVMDGKILDGNHRLHHAINNNIEHVDAKIFTTNDLP